MDIFGNPISSFAKWRAERQRDRYARKFGFDPEEKHPLGTLPVPEMEEFLRIHQVVPESSETKPIDSENALVIGTIRMGYGHHRIGIALASAAQSMGLRPHWLDINSFEETAGGKIVRHLEGLYSLGSRLSQQFPLFDKLYWEPLTSKGFRHLTYNAADQHTCELMAPLFEGLGAELPIVCAHTWPAQAAVHAGMRHVVNVIPDNWPLGLHLAEGSQHAVQSPSVYLGYRMLKGMGKHADDILRPMPSSALSLTGHYVDHELVANLENDCAARIGRMERGDPRRLLLSIGGAGAQGELALAVIRKLANRLADESVALLINTGDHVAPLDLIVDELDSLGLHSTIHNTWTGIRTFARKAEQGQVQGLHIFHHPDIFPAVYTTNLLMRVSDVLLTKPSELAYYPVPKIFLRRLGGHEAWGAIRSTELGDGTPECESQGELLQAVELMVEDKDLLRIYCDAIVKNHRAGIYNGAYRVVDMAMEPPVS